MRVLLFSNVKKSIKPKLPLLFIDIFHFSNNSLENLVKNLGENDLYYLSQEFNANDLLKKRFYFPMADGIPLKIFKKDYLAKDKFYNTLANPEISQKKL